MVDKCQSQVYNEVMGDPFDPMDLEHQAWRAQIDKLVAQHLAATVDLRESIDLTNEEKVESAA